VGRLMRAKLADLCAMGRVLAEVLHRREHNELPGRPFLEASSDEDRGVTKPSMPNARRSGAPARDRRKPNRDPA
jgi:hypothetical protein